MTGELGKPSRGILDVLIGKYKREHAGGVGFFIYGSRDSPGRGKRGRLFLGELLRPLRARNQTDCIITGDCIPYELYETPLTFRGRSEKTAGQKKKGEHGNLYNGGRGKGKVMVILSEGKVREVLVEMKRNGE